MPSTADSLPKSCPFRSCNVFFIVEISSRESDKTLRDNQDHTHLNDVKQEPLSYH